MVMATKRKSVSADGNGAAAAEEESNTKSQRRSSLRAAQVVKLSRDTSAERAAEEMLEVDDGEGEVKPLETGVNENEKKLDKPVRQKNQTKKEVDDSEDTRFLGEPVPGEEARRRWVHRYDEKDPEVTQARYHFLQAEVDGQIFNLEDDAYVKSEAGKENYICKIIEFFVAVDGSKNFAAQWYYRATDTVMKECGSLIDARCIFFSEIKDDNALNCLVKKLKIVNLPMKAELDTKERLKSSCDYYYDKMYLLPYTSFVTSTSDAVTTDSESDSTISSDNEQLPVSFSQAQENCSEQSLLDLYSGCGAMSTGLCLGANSCSVKLVTKWAVDINQYACESLKLNHPETQVRNESAEDFLHLLKEWEKLCNTFLMGENNDPTQSYGNCRDSENDDDIEDIEESDSDVFEVEEILSVCFGDPNKTGQSKLHFKIRWKGYDHEEDTWEALDSLSSCQDKLKEFVSKGYKSKILPLPGTIDVICGGPPCQGISGFNRFRNKEKPLEDPKNKQLVVFMDTVLYLRPKFVLMENVVDLVKFSGGFLGKYALASLVAMGYQTRMGMMAAGAYGLPQFRMRVFVWGALDTEHLPQYPLPTHNVVVRGGIPTDFEQNMVAHEEGHKLQLKKELFLGDAISDLPPVANCELQDEMPYSRKPGTEFQHYIRLQRDEMPGSLLFNSRTVPHNLYDHRPLMLNQDDYERVCQIPKKKGANFRNLPGVRVRDDNKVEWDPDVERIHLSSGKPLVPDYAMSFVGGSSTKPFGRLWWDETVPTVVTRAEPHNQRILHPCQDRVLTIRENARLQGFPDYYKLIGPVKERYIQVGNAVAVAVSRALGYSLGLAVRGLSTDEPLLTLPNDYPFTQDVHPPAIV